MLNFIHNVFNERYLKKTIMSKEKSEMYRQDFQERHEKALRQDIDNLSDVINAFHDEKVTVWHCCTSDGYGYYTVSNGTKKRFVHSEYRLECVGGCWSLHVYERLYMGQVNLMKFLDAIKAEICKIHLVEMTLKTLYIAYILTDLDKWEKSLKDEYYREEDRHDFEIARGYQKEFTEQYPKQIEIYNDTVSKGGNFWSYYNGADNYEYSYVADILENAVSEIYENREQLETCELWDKSRKVIDTLNEMMINMYISPQQNSFIETERKVKTNGFIFGHSGVGKASHPWDNLKRCPKCGYYPWIVGKDLKSYESGSPYTIICMNKAKCDCRSLQSYNVELCIEDWNQKT